MVIDSNYVNKIDPSNLCLMPVFYHVDFQLDLEQLGRKLRLKWDQLWLF
jgi:hypothetical protein